MHQSQFPIFERIRHINSKNTQNPSKRIFLMVKKHIINFLLVSLCYITRFYNIYGKKRII